MGTLEGWTSLFQRLPRVRFREVIICGGEPTLVPFVPDLANWLLRRGYHVMMLTNLANPETILGVGQSYRFKVLATYHTCDDVLRFHRAWQKVRDIHETEVKELKLPKIFSFSKMSKLMNAKEIDSPEFQVAPDAVRCYISCYDLYADLSK
jgi:organic radical activating enzyme